MGGDQASWQTGRENIERMDRNRKEWKDGDMQGRKNAGWKEKRKR